MKKIENIKHILIISLVTLFLIFGAFFTFASDFFVPINYFFIYRTGQISETNINERAWQDKIYKHTFTPSKNIVVVTIDEKTMNYYNSKAVSSSDYSMLTIPKSDYIQFMNNLKVTGAKGVAFDIIFQNRDKDENGFVSALLENGNAVIATTLPRWNTNSLSTGNAVNSLTSCTTDQDSENIITCNGTPRSVYGAVKWGLIQLSDTIKELGNEVRILNYNIADFPEQAIAKFGKKSITKNDKNNIINTLPLELVKDSELPAVKKLLALPVGSKIMQPYYGGELENKTLWIYKTISFIDFVQKWSMYGSIMKDSYVFVGETGAGIHDKLKSPASNILIPGVYTHAYLLDSILQNKILKKIDIWTYFVILTILTIIFTNIYFFSSKFVSPILAIITIFAIIFICRYIYDKYSLVVDIFPIFLGTSLLSYPITYIYKFFIIEKDKRQIIGAFSRYLSPSVVNMIDKNKIEVSLGGEKKELSILFSDIAGFTTISEKMDTKELFSLMTRYLSRMTDILISQNGTLDKYIWDAVMGFFGAPVEDPFHAKNACETAIRMRAALADFNTILEKEWKEKIDFRVGIATGEVMVGNIGSEKQFNYTVLGDTVNLASRLEATGKEYHVNVIIAGWTRKAIGDEFIVRELDEIAVKWKTEWVRIFELLGKKWDAIDMTKYTTYESALRLYREGKYLEAGRVWWDLAPIDPPSEIMMNRCLQIIKWEMTIEDGVFKMTHK